MNPRAPKTTKQIVDTAINILRSMTMKLYNSLILTAGALLALFLLTGPTTPLHADEPADTPTPAASPAPTPQNETAVIPGNADLIGNYTNFFYNYPSADFCFHLNDRLLFLDRPDEILTPNGFRNQLLNIVRWHKILKISLQRAGMSDKNTVNLDLTQPDQLDKTKVLLTLMGLQLTQDPNGAFTIAPAQSQGVIDYFRFVNLGPEELQARLNKTKRFHFEFRENEIAVPFRHDFLQGVTGIKLDKHNFFEHMLKNERFSLLLAALFRLSDREINAVEALGGDSPLRIWKEIYNDKKFLMGFFYLSAALRFTNTNQFDFPGGPEALPFWKEITGENPETTPLRFLYRLATLDDGKLNYLYIFTRFLPEKTQKLLLADAGGGAMKTLYRQISLSDAEKLRDDQFSGPADFSPFTFFYPFPAEKEGLYFPLGVTAWVRAIAWGGDEPGAQDPESVGGVTLTGADNLFRESKIVLKNGETIKGRIRRVDNSRVVLDREMEIPRDDIANMDLPQPRKETEPAPSNSPNADTAPASGAPSGKQDESGAFTFDNIEKDPNAEKNAGKVADMFEKQSTSLRIFGKFWPAKPIFLKLSMNYLQPNDPIYRENYGSTFYIPEFRVGVFFTSKISVWYAYTSFKGKTTVDITGLPADATQTMNSYGFGYHMSLTKKIKCSFDLSLVNVHFEENALGLIAEDSATGVRLGVGVGVTLGKSFFTDINTYYTHAPITIDSNLSAKLGGFGAGFGLGFRL